MAFNQNIHLLEILNRKNDSRAEILNRSQNQKFSITFKYLNQSCDFIKLESNWQPNHELFSVRIVIFWTSKNVLIFSVHNDFAVKL